jgi:hypothetical protein
MTWENIVSACLKCNVRKGGRTPQEAGMTLRQNPSKPHRNPAFEIQLAKRKVRLLEEVSVSGKVRRRRFTRVFRTSAR